jgi:pyruvate,water dikinase
MDEIKNILKDLDTHNIRNLSDRGERVRQAIMAAQLPEDLNKEITKAYKELEKKYGKNIDTAVRSSATAEDLPDASFAGQQDTYLNIKGIHNVLYATKQCIASLFTNRAISYREDKGFDHFTIALSVGVQVMVRSDRAVSGVMFSIDTESGFRDAVLINAAYGLGENIVQGKITPDEFYVFQPTLKKGFRPIIEKNLGSKALKLVYSAEGKSSTKNVSVPIEDRKRFCIKDEEVLKLAEWATIIEEHYKRPMDMEWAKDGVTGKLFIVQARPETAQSVRDTNVLEEYILKKKSRILCSGASVGYKIGKGKVNVIKDVSNIEDFKKGEVLVTEMTDPDWEPIMKVASAIVTNSGGRTCFSGDTLILTNKGYLPISEIVKNYKKENYKVISINKKNLKIEWKEVIGGMKRKSHLIKIGISQTGRMKNNNLKITPDHKVLTFENRKLISKEISEVIGNGDYLTSAQKIPKFGNVKLSNELAYVLGAISTDGNVYLSQTHGEVQFIQKPTKNKRKFIQKVINDFEKVYGYQMKEYIRKESAGIIRGSKIIGSANAYRCYSKEIALKFKEEQNSIVNSILSSSDEFVYNFLAGVIDGDGTYNEKNNRINIFCSKDYLARAISVACMRLDIAYSITQNRNIFNIQIVNKIDELFKYTTRVNGSYNRLSIGTKLFSARQLLSDIEERINYKGRIKPYIKNNLLIDIDKIKNNLIPMIAGQVQNHQLTNIVNSDLKMLRVKKEEELGENEVFNITVKDNHNYVVFTNEYTPILVNNCHAAIVSRELGIPCVVGTRICTEVLKTGKEVTVSCAEGEEGYVYDGLLNFEIKKTNLKGLKKPKVKVMMNLAEPDQAFTQSFIPNDGVGLAREEFIINNTIKVHPLALMALDKKIKGVVIDRQTVSKIHQITNGYKNKTEFFVDKLAQGIGKLGAAFYPNDVIVRFSDFKSNEYANLIGGKYFEPQEENPMIGWRGASRYYDPKYKEAFKLECQAIKKVREEFGLENVIVMVPFCRTVEEGEKVLAVMKEAGLERGKKGLRVYVMAEIPSNVILVDEFAKIFDGFSIGSNDLTQLALGIDRDNGNIAHIANEKNEAVKILIRQLIKGAHKRKRKVGICGQAPSDFPDFAEFVVKEGIDSISLTPDTVLKTMVYLGKKK